jgi:hypothetical protein
LIVYPGLRPSHACQCWVDLCLRAAGYDCTGATRGSSINQQRRIGAVLGQPGSNSFLAAPRRQTANTFYAEAFQSARRIATHSSAAPPPQSGFVQLLSLRDPPAHFSLAPIFLAAGPRKESIARNDFTQQIAEKSRNWPFVGRKVALMTFSPGSL